MGSFLLQKAYEDLEIPTSARTSIHFVLFSMVPFDDGACLFPTTQFVISNMFGAFQ